jgi:pimeloyl-ACP methyl ester carboxylesterase
MRRSIGWRRAGACVAALTWSSVGAAELSPHDAVVGVELTQAYKQTPSVAVDWASLSTTYDDRAEAMLNFVTPIGIAALEVPFCATMLEVKIDGKVIQGVPRPAVFDLPLDDQAHRVGLRIKISGYESRVACSYAPRFGTREKTLDGLNEFSFLSLHAREGGGKAVVFIPKAHDMSRPSALLVGLHPWNGGIWSYAAYAELLREANAKDIVLLMPSGLGNSLYTEHAEDEVLPAFDELSRAVAIDRRRVSIWGASMGGAGATTIGFHHPDRFATITSFFGDSKYDLGTYVHTILRDEAGAHRVNALDVVDNARNVPVWLIHGEDDRVSPLAQSDKLADALRTLGFPVRFDRVPQMGHSGLLVTRFIAEMVDRAALARVPEAPERVSFVSVEPHDSSVYGIRLVRGGARGDASIDLERRDDGVHVLRARGVHAVVLPRGAFGAPPASTLPVVIDDAKAKGVNVRWDALP